MTRPTKRPTKRPHNCKRLWILFLIKIWLKISGQNLSSNYSQKLLLNSLLQMHLKLYQKE